MKKTKSLILVLIVCLTLNSCQALFEFDMKRISYVFIFTLIVGIVGMILHFINDKNNKK